MDVYSPKFNVDMGIVNHSRSYLVIIIYYIYDLSSHLA